MFLYAVKDHVAGKHFGFNVFENDATAKRGFVNSELAKAPHPEDFEVECLASLGDGALIQEVTPCFHSVFRFEKIATEK